MNTFTGWLAEIDHERLPSLEAMSMPTSEIVLFGAENELPEEIDCRAWYRPERQARNDCGGFSNSAVGEAAFVIATGQVLQFSPHFCYREAQRIDGITGDRGSTISGGLEAAKLVGYCLEALCPYPSRYDVQVTAEQRKAAEEYRVSGHAVIRRYEEAFNWLATGQGAVNWGIAWRFSPGENSFVLDRFHGGGPGHATALAGYSKRKDRSGRNYLLLVNSGYPVPGVYEVAPDAIQQALDDRYTVALGVSQLSVPRVESIGYRLFGSET